MAARPIVLLGSERVSPEGRGPTTRGLHFDGRVGVWRDQQGRLAVLASEALATTETRTREGTDQCEVSFLSTYNTKTHEATDQVEAADWP